MQYRQYDYHPSISEGESDSIQGWWSNHWAERTGLNSDQFDEPIWGVIEDAITHPGIILEAGCGVPHWVKHFDRLGLLSIGVDFAASGLLVGRKENPDLLLVRSDFRNLALADNSVDYILSIGAIEHDGNGPAKSLAEFCRVLKPDGWLLCSVPCLNTKRQFGLPYLVFRDWIKRRKLLRRLWHKTDPFEFYQYVWSPSTYESLLHRSGFSLVDLRGYGYGSKQRSLESMLNSYAEFFSPHMMMAICCKRPLQSKDD